MQALLDGLAADCREAEDFERHYEAATGQEWDREDWAELVADSDPEVRRQLRMALYAGMSRFAEHIRQRIEGERSRIHD